MFNLAFSFSKFIGGDKTNSLQKNKSVTKIEREKSSGKINKNIKKRGRESEMTIYAVVRGRVPGIYKNIQEAHDQVSGFSNSLMRGFKTEEGARALINHHLGTQYLEENIFTSD